MDACLVGWSALEAWRAIRALGPEYLEAVMATPATTPRYGFSAHLTKREADTVADAFGLSWPVQLAVVEGTKRHTRPYAKTMLLSPGETKNAFVEIEPGLFLALPPQVFQQMSTFLSTVDLVRVGYELCSRFAIGHHKEYELIESAPLTTLDKLADALPVPNARGNCTRTSSALLYIKENAASPPEIAMSMELGLPFVYGGLGLGDHVLNPYMELSEHAQILANKKFCYPDLYLQTCNTDIEYDSYEWHSGEEKKREDARRRGALRYDGHHVVSLDADDLKDAETMTALARDLYTRSGIRFRPYAKNFCSRQEGLIETLKKSEVVRFEKSG